MNPGRDHLPHCHTVDSLSFSPTQWGREAAFVLQIGTTGSTAAQHSHAGPVDWHHTQTLTAPCPAWQSTSLRLLQDSFPHAPNVCHWHKGRLCPGAADHRGLETGQGSTVLVLFLDTAVSMKMCNSSCPRWPMWHSLLLYPCLST